MPPRNRNGPCGVFAGEASLLFALFGLWQYAGSFTLMGPAGALSRARWIWHAERVMHLPSETSVQRLFLPHPLLVQLFNLYYDSCISRCWSPAWSGCTSGTATVTRRSGRRWPFTGASLVIQFIPVAPPRMLPSTGLVDTAMKYHQSVYGTVGFDPDQLSAMPSVHVGWALIVAFAVITMARSRWRWLAVGYPILTTLAVVVTANHFWLDGIVAGALVAVIVAGQRLARGLRSAKSSRKDQVKPEQEELSVK